MDPVRKGRQEIKLLDPTAFSAILVILFLQRERLMENEAASAGKAARTALLAASFPHLKLICLGSFYGMNRIKAPLEKHGRLRRPRPEALRFYGASNIPLPDEWESNGAMSSKTLSEPGLLASMDTIVVNITVNRTVCCLTWSLC